MAATANMIVLVIMLVIGPISFGSYAPLIASFSVELAAKPGVLVAGI
jgi:hypothetical protein